MRPSSILAKIERGEPVVYDGVIVVGDLDLSEVDLPTKRVERTEYEIKYMDLAEGVKLVESSISIIGSEIRGGVNFGNAIFQQPVNFAGTTFCGRDAYFGGAIFSGITDWMADFKWAADFGWATNFERAADFSRAKFNGSDAYFGATEFSGGSASFLAAEFNRDAYFEMAEFNGGSASFMTAEFNGKASFREAAFSGNADFNGAKFTGGNASFVGAKFSGGSISFMGAEFNGDADFGMADFSGGSVSFMTAEFNGDADFMEAEFSDASFMMAEFDGDADFREAEFREASFMGATLGGEGYFEGAKFRIANFEGASADFREKIDSNKIMGDIRNGTSVEYNYVIINGDMILNEGLRTSSSINITNSEIQGIVKFSNIIFQKSVNFESTNFNNETHFTGAKFDESALFEWSRFSGDADFEEVRFCDSATFRGAQFSANTDFKGAQFRGDAYFEEVLFNNNPNFKGVQYSGIVNLKGSSVDFRERINASDIQSNILQNVGLGEPIKYNGVIIEGNLDLSSFENLENVQFNSTTFLDSINFEGVNFDGPTYFKGTQFIGPAHFGEANFNGHSDFSNSQFNDNADFTGARFHDTLDLTGLNFTHLYIKWDSINHPICYSDITYLKLIKYFRELGQFENADGCYYDYRQESQKKKSWLQWAKYRDILALITCGYGVRPSHTLACSFVLITLFGLIFWAFNGIHRISITQYVENAQEGCDKGWSISDMYIIIKTNIWDILRRMVLDAQKILKNIPATLFKILGTLFKTRPRSLFHLIKRVWNTSFITDVSLKQALDSLYFSSMVFISQPPPEWRPKESWKWKGAVMLENVLGWLLLALFLVTLGNVMIR